MKASCTAYNFGCINVDRSMTHTYAYIFVLFYNIKPGFKELLHPLQLPAVAG